jgi:hypothetical protein
VASVTDALSHLSHDNTEANNGIKAIVTLMAERYAL